MNDPLREALRLKIEKHNRLVLLSTVATGLFALLLWPALFFLARWFYIFFATVIQGVETHIPQHLDRTLLLLGAGWIVAGWIDRQRRADELPGADPSLLSTLLAILLLPPRITLGVFDNLKNRIVLTEPQLQAAANFLARLVELGKLPLTALPVEWPDEGPREHILGALRLLELIQERRIAGLDCLTAANPEKVRAFL
jgi:hypothetical protein